MSDKLKPCPFCGGKAECKPLAKGCRVYAVLCVSRYDGTCMARQWGAWTRKDKAIAAWNRRTVVERPCAKCDDMDPECEICLSVRYKKPAAIEAKAKLGRDEDSPRHHQRSNRKRQPGMGLDNL